MAVGTSETAHILPAILGFALGCFVLVLALARARLLPRWTAFVPVAAIAIQLAGLQPWSRLDLSQAVAVLPFAWLGVRLAVGERLGARHLAPAIAHA